MLCVVQVDIPTFVTEKVLKTAMRHLHTCLLATRHEAADTCKIHSLTNHRLVTTWWLGGITVKTLD